MFKTFAGIQSGGHPAPVMSPAAGRAAVEPETIYLIGMIVAEIIGVWFLSTRLLK